MDKDSLEKARIEVIKALDELNIDKLDKAELIINLYHFLDKENYEENVKTLKKIKKKGE